MSKTNTLSDEQVVEQVRSKNQELYTEIMHRYEKKLMRYTATFTGDTDKAADIVQNAFIKAYMNLQGFDTKKKFSSWIYRITHNEAINYLKQQKQHQPIDAVFDLSDATDLEDDVIQKELSEQTHDCLRHMSSKYSEPLILYYMEERSYEEISDILRIPMGTVATRINRGKGDDETDMSKKTITISDSVMSQIQSGSVRMRPKIYFVLGSLLTLAGVVSSLIVSVFLISLLSFSLRTHGPMGEYRYEQLLSSFPWWAIIIAVGGMVSGILFLRTYDFSYKRNFFGILVGIIAAVILSGWLIDTTGLDTVWGPLRIFYEQYDGRRWGNGQHQYQQNGQGRGYRWQN